MEDRTGTLVPVPPELTALRLLVVDDEEANLMLLRGILVRAGYRHGLFEPGELAGEAPWADGTRARATRAPTGLA